MHTSGFLLGASTYVYAYVGAVLFLENRYTLVVMLIVYDGELVVKSHLLLYYGGRQDTVRVARR